MKNPILGQFFLQEEKREGHSVDGQYSVLLPDKRLMTVMYTVDERGYRPKITYQDVSMDAEFQNFTFGNQHHLTNTYKNRTALSRKIASTSEKMPGNILQTTIPSAMSEQNQSKERINAVTQFTFFSTTSKIPNFEKISQTPTLNRIRPPSEISRETSLVSPSRGNTKTFSSVISSDTRYTFPTKIEEYITTTLEPHLVSRNMIMQSDRNNSKFSVELNVLPTERTTKSKDTISNIAKKFNERISKLFFGNRNAILPVNPSSIPTNTNPPVTTAQSTLRLNLNAKKHHIKQNKLQVHKPTTFAFNRLTSVNVNSPSMWKTQATIIGNKQKVSSLITSTTTPFPFQSDTVRLTVPYGVTEPTKSEFEPNIALIKPASSPLEVTPVSLGSVQNNIKKSRITRTTQHRSSDRSYTVPPFITVRAVNIRTSNTLTPSVTPLNVTPRTLGAVEKSTKKFRIARTTQHRSSDRSYTVPPSTTSRAVNLQTLNSLRQSATRGSTLAPISVIARRVTTTRSNNEITDTFSESPLSVKLTTPLQLTSQRISFSQLTNIPAGTTHSESSTTAIAEHFTNNISQNNRKTSNTFATPQRILSRVPNSVSRSHQTVKIARKTTLASTSSRQSPVLNSNDRTRKTQRPASWPGLAGKVSGYKFNESKPGPNKLRSIFSSTLLEGTPFDRIRLLAEANAILDTTGSSTTQVNIFSDQYHKMAVDDGLLEDSSGHPQRGTNPEDSDRESGTSPVTAIDDRTNSPFFRAFVDTTVDFSQL